MAGALPPSHLDKHHSPAGANFTSHQKKGILDHSGKHFFLYLDVAIRGNLLAGTLRTLGETVGDRSFPVWSPPLTFSPLVSAPYHRHRLHISLSWSSYALSLASNFFQVTLMFVCFICGIFWLHHWVADFLCGTKISLLCFHPSTNSTCSQDGRALRPGLCPAHVPNEEISLAPKPTQTLR